MMTMGRHELMQVLLFWRLMHLIMEKLLEQPSFGETLEEFEELIYKDLK